MSVAAASLAIVCVALAGFAFLPDLAHKRRMRPKPAPKPRRGHSLPDPGEQLRAERRAEKLLAEVLGADALEAYKALGFLPTASGPSAAASRPTAT